MTSLPLRSARGDLNFQIRGRETPPGVLSRRADWQVVTPGYFEAMGMRIVRGRGIAAGDRADTEGAIVFNEAAARLHWPGGDALGARLKLGANAGPGWVTVVGIVNDVRTGSLRTAPRPEMYLAHTQFRMFGRGTDPMRTLSVVIQTQGAPAVLADVLRREVQALDPALAADRIQTMDSVRRVSVARLEFVTTLLGIVRGARAHGGTGWRLRRDGVLDRAAPAGDRAARGARRQSRTSGLVRVAPRTDPGGGRDRCRAAGRDRPQPAPHYATVRGPAARSRNRDRHRGLVAAISLLACYLPARRAARLDPSSALRNE